MVTTFLFNIILEAKEIKIILKEKLKRLEKEEIKLHLFEDHHCLYFLQNFPSIKSKEEKESVRIN